MQFACLGFFHDLMNNVTSRHVMRKAAVDGHQRNGCSLGKSTVFTPKTANTWSKTMNAMTVKDEAIATFEAMVSIVTQEGYPLLNHYKQDLYKYDFENLMRSHTRGARYMWIVRDSGTHLVRLGVHPKMNEELEAVLALYRDCEIYVVQDARLKQISREQAAEELKKLDYSVVNGQVIGPKGPLAWFNVRSQPRYTASERAYAVDCEACPGTFITAKDLLALIQIVQSEMIKAAQSFFVCVDEITLNKLDLHDLFMQCSEIPTGIDLSSLLVKERLAA